MSWVQSLKTRGRSHWGCSADIGSLSLVFLLLLFVAPLLYNAFRQEVKTDPPAQHEYQGFVWDFAMSCAVTLWAAFDEMATVFFIAVDLRETANVGGRATITLLAAIVATIVLVIVYAWRSIQATIRGYRILTTQTRPELTERVFGPGTGTAEPELPRWSIL